MSTGPDHLHLDDDFLLEVVHGLVPAADVERAVAHAATCAPCDARLREAAADRERFRARMGQALLAERPQSRRRVRAGILLAAAAAVLTIVASVVLLRAPVPRRTPAFLTLPAPLEMVHLRSRAEPADLPRLEEALQHYAQGDWAGTRKKLEAPFAEPRFESLRRLYLASALLELGRTVEARAELEEIGNAPLPDPYADWRDWARFRTSPEARDVGRADSVVRVLAGRPGPLQEKARRLLEGGSESPAQVPQ